MAGEPYGSPFNEAGSDGVFVMFLSGGLGLSSAANRSSLVGVSGGLQFAPDLRRTAAGILTAALSLAGASTRLVSVSFSGSVSSSATALRRMPRQLAGAFSLAGSYSKRTEVAYSGGLASSSGMTRRMEIPLVGAVSYSGGMARTFFRIMGGLIAPAAVTIRYPKRKLAGALGSSSRISRYIDSTPIDGGLVLSGTGLGGARYFKVITGAVAAAGSAGRATGVAIAGTLGMVADRYKKLTRSGPYGIGSTGSGPTDHSQTDVEGY